MQVCPGCGESNPGRFKECAFCGQPLGGRTGRPTEERKTLTVIFCDLKGSTEMGEKLDPESLSEVLDLYFKSMTRILERHGGAIQKFIGDAIVCAFGIPLIHEDDALRAVRAAAEMRDSLDRLNERLQAGYGVDLHVRIGVHTGEVLVRESAGSHVLTGDTMNTAARLEQYAGTDEVFIGEPTYRLVRDAVEVEALPPMELKGKSEPVPAYRLLSVFGDEQASRRHDAPIVGREKELAQLDAAYRQAVSERRAVLATVLGEAGVGKSRLVTALLDSVGDEATVLRSRCLPYGEGITFLPLLGIVRAAASITPDDPSDVATSKLDALTGNPEVTRRIASAVGWSREALPVAEVFWAARELFSALASERPGVIVVDDVHWAEPVLLDLLQQLIEQVDDAAMLILCTARPHMLEEHEDWSEGERASRLILERLPDGATAQVIANLMGGVELPEQVSTTILSAAEGNPLFVEQLISMLVDQQLLVKVGGQWQASGSMAHLDLPPSIHALLTARLDMLQPQERRVIEPASVIGLDFASGALRELVPTESKEVVPVHLATMERRQLVRPLADNDELGDYRFHHVLIRDAAYQRTLKRARAELHELFADWLEQWDRNHGRSGEHDEVVGYHLEQAFLLGGQLGPIDAHIRVLGSRGAEKLSAAGQRAFARGDLPAAINLLGRAVDILPPLDPIRLALIPELAEATMETGEFERAVEILAEAETPAAAEINASASARARLIRLLVDFYVGRDEDWSDRVEQESARAIEVSQAAGDETGLAAAWRLRYGVEAVALRFESAAAAAEHVIDHAEAAGDIRQQRRGAVAYAVSALHGPTPVSVGIERCEELVHKVEGDRRSQASIQLCLSVLVAMDGDVDRARDLYRGAQLMLLDLGPSVLAAATSTEVAQVEIIAGDLDAAERQLRSDNRQLQQLGENSLRSSVIGILARVLVIKGESHEAQHFALEAKSIAAPDDVEVQVWWRSALSRAWALQDRADDALRLAEEAVQMASSTSAPLVAAQALSDRATVLAAVGRVADALADLSAARGIYLAKGDRTEAAPMERLIAELSDPASLVS